MRSFRPAAAVLLLALAAAAVAGVASDSWRASVEHADSNKGLKPQRLEAFNRMHYFQLAEEAIGTLVSLHAP